MVHAINCATFIQEQFVSFCLFPNYPSILLSTGQYQLSYLPTPSFSFNISLKRLKYSGAVSWFSTQDICETCSGSRPIVDHPLIIHLCGTLTLQKHCHQNWGCAFFLLEDTNLSLVPIVLRVWDILQVLFLLESS